MHQALNQNAQCACSLGAVTCGGKQIHKDCQVLLAAGSGVTATDDLEPVEDGDVHSRLTSITQENQVIKAQLSQLTELVWQLLP